MMWLIVVLGILIVSYLLDLVITVLNLQALDPKLPNEFKDVYDHSKYAKSQDYTRVTSRFALIENSLTTIITIAFLVSGGFNIIDTFSRNFGFGPIITGLIFTGSLMSLTLLMSLPFSIYSTFSIEEKFGFNTTKPKTFILDLIKSLLLAIILGVPLLSLILWFFQEAGSLAWVYSWVGVIVFTTFVQFIAPVIILPLFNKFTPMEQGDLLKMIMGYADIEKFRISGIFTMDGSKRSTKLNALFTGFGRFRKIVLFDTLIEKLNKNQIVAVLAHEMGHNKLRHLIKRLGGSVLQTGLMFYFLSLVIMNEGIFYAFGMEHVSIYASLTFFGFLFSPVSLLISLVFNYQSRQHEYEADNYAASSTGTTEHLITGLKILSKENLSNLTPHPLHVVFHYSHPPILERINALRRTKNIP